MWLFAGLGNPGSKYEGNRHNIGFMAVGAIADGHAFSTFRSKFQGDASEGRISGEKVLLLKPSTWMNNSGVSVSAAANFFKIPPEKIIVFHDELDLEPGKIRVRRGGGAAGHNGIRSIDSHLGTPDYWRVRMGIGHPGDKNRVHGYVLGDFSVEERLWLPDLLKGVSDNSDCLVSNRPEDFMTKIAAFRPASTPRSSKNPPPDPA